MLKIEKEKILAAIELHPASFIGREILLKGKSHSVKIEDVNLKCNQFLIVDPANKVTKWINVNDLEDETVFDSFDSCGQSITIKTILGILSQ